MLGKHYSLSKQCCGIHLTKSRMVHIKLESKIVETEQSLNSIQMSQPQQLYGEGNSFYNTYTNYCIVVPMPCCSTNTVQIEMNNSRVTETKIPNCCPCTGPYPVYNRLNGQIGQLKPNCYICHLFCGFSTFHPFCMSLDIYDKNMNKVYVVNRQPWTCFCCTRWEVKDSASQIKGEILNLGLFCPDLTIKLPNDTEDNKKLVMSAVYFLP